MEVITSIFIILLGLAVLVLLAACFWLMEQNGRLRERLYEAEEELELAPIPWGKAPDLRTWDEIRNARDQESEAKGDA